MNKLGWIFLLSPLFFSCSDATYEKNIDIIDATWQTDSAFVFAFEIDDISSEYQISYVIRNNLEYPYHNLFLEYYLLNSKNNKIKTAVQEVILMNEKTGKPYGTGFSGIYQNKFIAENIRFPEKGKYTFQLNHYMRGEKLEGILSVGIELKKITQK